MNFAWLIERFQWVAEKIAQAGGARRGRAGGARGPTACSTTSAASTPPRIEKFTVGQQLFVGLRGSYGGLLMFGLATTLAGMPLINPISIGAGAAFGAKSIWDERGSRLKRRQATAKTAAQRHVDDFFLSYGKESRDTARQVQRGCATTSRRSSSSCRPGSPSGRPRPSARRRRTSPTGGGAARRSRVEVDRLVELHKRIQALVRPARAAARS